MKPLRTFGWLLRRALVATYEDGCFSIAKSAAYSALLAFFPVLTVTAAILIQTKIDFVARSISEFLFVVVPPGTHELVKYTFTAKGARPRLLPVGAVLISLWAASGVMTSLMDGFRYAYRIPNSRPFLRERGLAILLVFLSAVPVIAASALILFGGWVENGVAHWLGLLPGGATLQGWVAVAGTVARYAIAIAATIVVTSSLYYFGPNRPQKWPYVWPGAVVASALWLATTAGFAWYVRNIAHYNVLYGSIGAAIALLVWMYVLAVIALIGCEFNEEYERYHARV